MSKALLSSELMERIRKLRANENITGLNNHDSKNRRFNQNVFRLNHEEWETKVLA